MLEAFWSGLWGGGLGVLASGDRGHGGSLPRKRRGEVRRAAAVSASDDLVVRYPGADALGFAQNHREPGELFLHHAARLLPRTPRLAMAARLEEGDLMPCRPHQRAAGK